MSGREFFVSRYRELGWTYGPVEPRQAIRINSMNAKTAEVVDRLNSRGIQLEIIPFVEDGFWISKSNFSVGATAEYLSGLYSIQEAAAQLPARLFAQLKHKLVLDACAAPGGKTVELANLMRNTGAIIALDIKKQRLAALANHLERCRVENVIAYNADARQASHLNLKFDRILLDVPCSGNFVVDKDWFSRRTMKDVENNAKLQRGILAEAAKVLKDDGEIVYSTCSLEPEEDELNIDWAIEDLNLGPEKINCLGERGLTSISGKELDSSIENCRRIWPGQTQGFFICKLRNRVSAQ